MHTKPKLFATLMYCCAIDDMGIIFSLAVGIGRAARIIAPAGGFARQSSEAEVNAFAATKDDGGSVASNFELVATG